ncbi:MAG: hypothetical protein AB7S26_25130 [Sandaracinaceae bacterium]
MADASIDALSLLRNAVHLGATIAFGGCALAGCDGSVETGKIPSIATSGEMTEPDAPPPSEDPDMDAHTGRLPGASVAPGFTPDPLLREGDIAGGPIDARRLDADCEGWIAVEPDVVVESTRPIAELAVMAASSVDTTLVVVGPDGRPRCANDSDGMHPIVRSDFAAGRYRIWVGAHERGAAGRFVMALTEFDDAIPGSLLH